MMRLLKRLSWLARGRRHEADLRDELRFHLDEDAEERTASGAPAVGATRAARLGLGNATLVMEDTRAMWIPLAFERVVQDLRYAVRHLRQAPVFTAVAVASLALGIGANTAVFTLFNEVLLRPLPVPDPGALVNFSSPGKKSGGAACGNEGGCDAVFSYPMYLDLQRAQTVFTGIAAHEMFGTNLAYGGQTERRQGVFVSGNYFSVLDLAPTLGRFIDATDDAAPGGEAVCVLSYDYWTARFNAAHDVAGKTMTVNGVPTTIVGVGPKGFNGTTVGSPAQVFVPITTRSRLLPPFSGFTDRRFYWVYLFARLKPRAGLDQARAALGGSYHTLLTNVDGPLQPGLSKDALAEFTSRPLVIEPGSRGQSGRDLGTALALLFAVTGIVLVIACANVANLLLARGAARATELAVRASIGASRHRLVGQLLVESCAIATAGGIVGLALAEWTLHGLIRAISDGAQPITVHLDRRILAFSVGLSLATGLLFGIFPALHNTRGGLSAALKNDAARSTGGRSASRFRAAMMFAQMALSTVLLVTAGLCLKSLVNVSRVDTGIAVDHLVTFTITPFLNGYASPATRDLLERTEGALAAMPGVEDAAASTVPLVGGSFQGTYASVQGGIESDQNSSAVSEVGPDFFATAGIPLLAGRAFTANDGPTAPKVAIVNEAFTKKLAPGINVVGRRMRAHNNDDPFDVEIVGVVRDAKYSQVKENVPAIFYTPYRQNTSTARGLSGASLYVRSQMPSESLLKMIPAEMAVLDPNLPVQNLRTMADQIRDNTSSDRVVAALAASFALLATLLAAIGLYGVLAYTVAQRTREFGVRMALGAAPARVRRLVLGGVARLVAIGAITGAGIALLVGHYLQALLYEVKGYDAWAFAGAVVTLTAVALTAGAAPAWRASRIDPMRALRHE